MDIYKYNWEIRGVVFIMYDVGYIIKSQNSNDEWEIIGVNGDLYAIKNTKTEVVKIVGEISIDWFMLTGEL